ncbi:c-type cytochrome biogenesis protein CcmI [Marinospirillum sp. MEB164]|uniref:C-type cytochrome biogenesis protein CcmI n=1 Tax=Marinospirillum alkalitolerans TaxID=3123374 RepID=A0ABW8PU26_9GAMM
MTSLWLGMALVGLCCALFLLWPLWLRPRLTERLEAQQYARQLANIQVYKQKLAQLDLELEERRLDQQGYQQGRTELEDLLLDDASDEVHVRPWAVPSRGLQAISTLLILGCVFWGSWALYQKLGAAQGLESYFAQQALIEEGQRDFGSLLRRLEEAVHNNPNDAEGWSLLVRIYMDLGLYEQGAEAMGELLRIQGPHPRLIAQQAQALYFADQGQITARVQALIDQALAMDASEPATLSLLGMAAYQNEQWDQARRHWEAALGRVQNVQAAESLREGINDVRARLGMEALAEIGPNFILNLALSDAAQLLTSPRATVFVYAVSERGGAPVAATRIRAGDLPIAVRLSDEQAMTPTNNLSSAQRVKLFARVSMSGTLEAQEGDWQGESDWFEVDGTQQVELLINRQL